MRPLTGVIKNYAWGSPSAIPAILGVQPDGKPQAEYWLGTHVSGTAQVSDTDTSLRAFLEEHPEVIGEGYADRYGARLPFLLKILAAEQPLSLQAHPSADQAVKGFRDEESRGIPLDDPTRTFKDDWPKPELLVALDDFEALSGFRDPTHTVELFDALEPKESIEQLISPLRHRSTEAGLAEVFFSCLCPDDGTKAVTDVVLSAALEHKDAPGELGEFARLAVRLDERYPADPSVLAALLLNHFRLRPGQGLHVPAGVLHAYMRGTGIEIMANSDNVVRGGLTPKHIDVTALVDLLDFQPGIPETVDPVQIDSVVSHYNTPDPQFSLWRLDCAQDASARLPGDDKGRILLVIDGYVEVRLDDQSEPTRLVQGQSAFFTADDTATVTGAGLAFVASPGQL